MTLQADKKTLHSMKMAIQVTFPDAKVTTSHGSIIIDLKIRSENTDWRDCYDEVYQYLHRHHKVKSFTGTYVVGQKGVDPYIAFTPVFY